MSGDLSNFRIHDRSFPNLPNVSMDYLTIFNRHIQFGSVCTHSWHTATGRATLGNYFAQNTYTEQTHTHTHKHIYTTRKRCQQNNLEYHHPDTKHQTPNTHSLEFSARQILRLHCSSTLQCRRGQWANSTKTEPMSAVRERHVCALIIVRRRRRRWWWRCWCSWHLSTCYNMHLLHRHVYE